MNNFRLCLIQCCPTVVGSRDENLALIETKLKEATDNGADFVSFGDHRIAMAFSIAAMFASGPSTIDDDSVIDISCPGI